MKKAKNVVLRRFIAFAIDWNVIILACVGLFLLGPRFDIEYLLRPSIKMFSSYGVILGILGFVFLPLFKDCLFKGASLGKLVCGLKVYDSRTQNVAKITSLIARNLTFLHTACGAYRLCLQQGPNNRRYAVKKLR